jgi:hypothetical protein
MLLPMSRCRRRRSLRVAATALPQWRCAPPPHFALPPLPPPSCRRRRSIRAAAFALPPSRCAPPQCFALPPPPLTLLLPLPPYRRQASTDVTLARCRHHRRRAVALLPPPKHPRCCHRAAAVALCAAAALRATAAAASALLHLRCRRRVVHRHNALHCRHRR